MKTHLILVIYTISNNRFQHFYQCGLHGLHIKLKLTGTMHQITLDLHLLQLKCTSTVEQYLQMKRHELFLANHFFSF